MLRWLGPLVLLSACTPTPAPRTPPPPSASGAPGLAYPSAPPGDATVEAFGVSVPDPYRWLEDAEAPATRAWVEAEDALARRTLSALPGRDALRERLRQLAYLPFASPPRRRGRCIFYERREAGQEQRALVIGDPAQPPLAAAPGRSRGCGPRVLIDVAKLSPDGTTKLGAWAPSHDGKRLAYVVHPNSADAGELRVLDVATGVDGEHDVIGGAKYAIPEWTPDGRGFYYVALPTDPAVPATERAAHAEVKLHRMGTPPTSDQVVFPKTGRPDTELEARLSHDGRFLFVSLIRGNSVSALHFRDLRAKDARFQPLVTGPEGTHVAIAHRGRFYLHTTEGADRGRVFRVDPAHPERARWQEIVPEHARKVLQRVEVVGGRLSLEYLTDGASEISLRALDGTGEVPLALPGIGSARGVFGTPDDPVGYVDYHSFDSPGKLLRVQLSSGKVEPWFEVPAPIDASAYRVERLEYPSRDGTPISMFVATRADAPRDGTTPFLLTGYGGFNISITPSFAPVPFTWLSAGGGVAVPGLRGGGERGEAWHRAGMLELKQNVFDDFLAAADFLIREGYTRPERLVISGRSNGGLLVGAAITQRPSLFRAALCAVPVLDMLRYPLFGDGNTWVSEYGSPEVEASFRSLLAYSPYHRVRPGTAYPALLMLSAEADDRVAPLHAWKMTAALQAASSSGRPILLRITRQAGHGGADQLKAKVDEAADALAFALSEVGLKVAEPPGERAGAAP